jgi:hypothetical protein
LTAAQSLHILKWREGRMPLEILLVLVTAGIAGIAMLLQLLGYSRQAPFTEDTARAAWLRHEPEIAPRRTDLSQDGLAALIDTDRGLGLVWHMGADSTAHWLDRARVTPTRGGLRVALGDFAAPSVRVRLGAEAARDWSDRIAAGAGAQDGEIA